MTEVSLDELKAAFRYEPETGRFFYTRNMRKNANPTGEAGRVAGRGYVYLSYRNIEYLAHRVAALVMEGAWPTDQIDHINGDKTDNRWCNLRHASHAENLWNRGKVGKKSVPFKGVYRTPEGRFKAEIKANGELRRLGHYDTAEEAAAAYDAAALKYHGAFAVTNFKSEEASI